MTAQLMLLLLLLLLLLPSNGVVAGMPAVFGLSP
jgi:hypothetical protein